MEIRAARAVASAMLACVIVCAQESAEAAEPAFDTLIAHRGESVDAPENTLPAYKTAVERGFGFECDIYLSKDGRVFTFHDRNLRRVTDGANTNMCGDVTWDEVSRLDVGNWGQWKNSKFKGTRPALLEEVLQLARDGRRIYVEVKTGPEIVPFVKDVFAKQTNATPGNVLFIAFNRETCKALKAQMPEYKVYLLTYAWEWWGKDAPPVTPKFLLDGLKETGADGIDCMYKPDIVTDKLIKAVRTAGYEFHVWTVDNLADTLEAFRRGVQTVTTNCAKSQLDAFRAELRPVQFWEEHGGRTTCVRVADAKPAATNGAFRILSYNIQMSYGIDGKLDPERTANRILAESPDFVCVQEVWSPARFKQLTGLLGMYGAFTHLGGCVGNAVFARTKPLKVEAFELPSSKYKRTLLICEFEDFAVASMHLDLDEGKRLASVPVVRKALARYAKPVFIAGDWNNWPNTPVLKGLKEFVTVISPEHDVHTFHKGTLERKECVIDYIAVDKAHARDFIVAGAWEVPDRSTSDHSPIVVDVSFANKR